MGAVAATVVSVAIGLSVIIGHILNHIVVSSHNHHLVTAIFLWFTM